MGSLGKPTTLISATLLLATGCTGTSTDNPYDPGEVETGGSGQCQEHRVLDLELNEKSELGFSAEDVLAGAAGTHQETLHWSTLVNGSYGPESGTQKLTLEITASGKARFVDYEPKDGAVTEIGSTCHDQVEIPVEVTLRSAQGALNEHFTTNLTAKSPRLGRIYYHLKAADLGGTLSVNAQDGYSLSELAIELEATPFGLNGEITPSLTKTSGDTASQAATGVLAWWGMGNCEQGGTAVPMDAKVASFSAEQALQQVADSPSTAARWSQGDDTSLTLGFEADEQAACAVLQEDAFAPPGADGAIGTLRVAGTLAAKSADGKLDAHWRGTLTAVPDAAGKLQEIGFENDGSEATGFTGVDLSSYDSSSVRSSLRLSPEGKWSGEITLTGYVNASCSSEVTQDSQGGSSSPGCPGADAKEVAKLTVP